MRVKIVGAGSIGNHLAQAARRMGWSVVVVDRDKIALERMKNDIYPSRYGAWDESIELFEIEHEPKGGFDIICICTPPDARMRIALQALRERPSILQLEKPLSFPFDPDLLPFLTAYKQQSKTTVVVGYDHAVSASIQRVAALLKKGIIGEVLTLDVEFREHWEGIFNAHPWLSGPADSYLGYWRRGGGASGEHSHALHLWQYLAELSGLGKWQKVSSTLKIEKENGAEYDSIAAFLFVTDSGNVGRVVQDVVTKPTRKWMRLQGSAGFIEWISSGNLRGDAVRYFYGDSIKEEVFEKKRPDDFYREILHINNLLKNRTKAEDSPIYIDSGIKVMEVLNTIWKQPNQSLISIEKINRE